MSFSGTLSKPQRYSVHKRFNDHELQTTPKPPSWMVSKSTSNQEYDTMWTISGPIDKTLSSIKKSRPVRARSRRPVRNFGRSARMGFVLARLRSSRRKCWARRIGFLRKLRIVLSRIGTISCDFEPSEWALGGRNESVVPNDNTLRSFLYPWNINFSLKILLSRLLS